mmetsp:Transcript_90563/g.196049  ORF Transcript_90563/g.196049 Transcript_90563/m.196049 type:complete len:298 (+) Transcript_90563:3-896(+)
MPKWDPSSQAGELRRREAELQDQVDSAAAAHKVARQLLLGHARGPLRKAERLSPQTREVWLAPPPGKEEVTVRAAGSRAKAGTKEEQLFTVEITCQATSAKAFFAGARTFAVMLPLGSNVGTLRHILDKDLPAKSRVMVQGREHPLQDAEEVPARVTVSEFVGKQELYLRFSRAQCSRVLEMMKVVLEAPEVQSKLDEMQATHGGSEYKHRLYLSQLLMAEVYPSVMQMFSLPCSKADSLRLIPASLTYVQDHLDLLEQQLEVELLMRNQQSVLGCYHAIDQFRARGRGAPSGDDAV